MFVNQTGPVYPTYDGRAGAAASRSPASPQASVNALHTSGSYSIFIQLLHPAALLHGPLTPPLARIAAARARARLARAGHHADAPGVVSGAVPACRVALVTDEIGAHALCAACRRVAAIGR